MTVCYRCAVQRKVPGYIYMIVVMLYMAVVINTILGAMFGFLFLIPSLGALFLAWYLMGEARVSYEYRLDDSVLTIMRTSGMRSRQKEVEFLKTDLKNLIAAGEQGDEALEEAEKVFRRGRVKGCTYDASAQDPDCPGALFYIQEAGRVIRVVLQENAQLTEQLSKLCPGKVRLSHE